MAKDATISKETLDKLVELGLDYVKSAADNMSKILKFDPPIKTDCEVTGKGGAKIQQIKKYIRTISEEIFDIVMDPEKDDKGLLLVNPEDTVKFEDHTNDLIKLICPERVEMLYTSKDAKDAAKSVTPNKKGFQTSEEVKERKKFIFDLIQEGKHTRADILDKIVAKYTEVKRATMSTFLTDCKNEKYNKYPKLAVEKDKVFSFLG